MPDSTKILVIEDDQPTQRIIQRTLTRDLRLRHLHIEVLLADDGEAGLEQFHAVHPALVITDLLMPKVDGFKVVEAIRADPYGQSCPIIVTTGVYRDRVALKGLHERRDVHVQFKPFLPAQLAQSVHLLLRAQRGGRAEDEAAPVQPPAESVPAHAPAGPAPERSSLLLPLRSGTLGEVRFARLLCDAYEARLSGTLELTRGKVRKIIYLISGHPVFVQSNVRSETLGQMLVRRRKLTSEQHARALAEGGQHGIKYGEALVKLGYLSEGEVMAELLVQTRIKLAACLDWLEGRWAFAEDATIADKVPHCVVDPVTLVFEGLQESALLEQAAAQLQKRARRGLRFTVRFARYRERFVATFGAALLERLAAGCAVRELLEGSGATHHAALQIEVLLQCGLVELTAAPAVVAGEEPRLSAETSVPLEELAAPQPKPKRSSPERGAPDAEPNEDSVVVWIPPRQSLASPQRTAEEEMALQLIQSTYLKLHGSSYYQVLGVTPQSDSESIEVAYQIKRKQFSPERFRQLNLGEHGAHLEEICRVLDQAFAVLSDPAQRAAYDASLGPEADEARSKALAAEMHCRRGEELFNQQRYPRAMEAFQQALTLDEQSEYQAKYALAYFMARRTERGCAGRALALVQQALAADPGDRVAHLVAATIHRESGSPEEALRYLQALVKLDPTAREAFDAAEQILLEFGAVEGLELQYRRTIHQLGERDREWSAGLWRRLTLLYRERLKDPVKTRTAGEVALRLKPNDQELRSWLAELDHQQPERWPQAVLGYRAMLRAAPESAAPLHQLFRLHRDGGRLDAALVAASAATLRGIANAEELQLLAQHRSPVLQIATRGLDPASLETLRHADDDARLASLFQLFTPMIERACPLRLADLEIEPDDLLEVEQLPSALGAVLQYVMMQIGIEGVRIVRKEQLGDDVQATATTPALLLVGGRTWESADRIELCFRLTRALSLLAPGRGIAIWQPRRVLRRYVFAALAVAFPEVSIPDPDGSVAVIRRALQAQPTLEASIRSAVNDLRDRFKQLNLSGWQRGIQRSADRLGLLLCGDLEVAGHVVAKQDREAERDLVDFALSEGYGQLRCTLGLART